MPSKDLAPVTARRKLVTKPFSRADKIFYGITKAASGLAVSIVGLILVFLFASSWPALQAQGFDFITGSTWDSSQEPGVFQLGPMIWGSFLIAFNGVFLAVPMAISIAYLIVFMLSNRLAKVATVLIDLLASTPSIVIGLWGFIIFAPVAAHWAELLNRYLGFLPFFKIETENFLGSPFIAGWITAVMIVPIIASVTREIFSQMDRDLINAGLALGGGRASTFFRIILPTSGGGIVGGTLLGFGRALGETVAILFVLNIVFDYNWINVTKPEGGSVASMILSKFGEAGPAEIEALLAAGLVLFVITLLVNWLAAFIVDKAQPWRK